MLRFSKDVDPLENLTAIGWKTYDRLGKASLFDNLSGFPGWRACNQIMTDRKKWAIGLGVDEDGVIEAFNSRVSKPVAPVIIGPHDAPVKQLI